MKGISKKITIIGLLLCVGLALGVYVFTAARNTNRQVADIGLVDKQTTMSKPGIEYGESKGAVQEMPSGNYRSSQSVATDSDMGGPVAVSGSSVNMPALPGIVEKVIRTANIELQVKKGKFNDTYDRAIGIAAGVGGYISNSNSAATNGKVASGELSLRIPANKFEAVLESLKKLGTVKAFSISSEEVSAEYVDLKSRLRNWRAQEAVMLDLMNRAKTISESIMVQNNLQQIQMEIEQISGRLQYLDDRTSYTTIQLNINEPYTVPVPVTDVFGIRTAFKEALIASSRVLTSLIIVLGYLVPLVLLAGLAYVLYLPIKKRLAVR